MAWLFFAIGATVVLLIAFVALGQVIGRLEHERQPAVYELDAAVDWIADRLPDEITAQLSYDDVGRILQWHLDWFDAVGIASLHGEELAGKNARTDEAVAIDEAAVDAVVARALSEAGSGTATHIDAVAVVCVLDLQMRYLTAIGAVGQEVSDTRERTGEGDT